MDTRQQKWRHPTHSSPLSQDRSPRASPAPTRLARCLPGLGAVLIAGWAELAVSALGPGAHAPTTAFRGFNFSYQTQGLRSAAPTQVFDDGRRTYLQFNALDRVPEIWVDEGQGRTAFRRLQVHLESPYIIVDQVVPRLRLVLDGEESMLINQAWSSNHHQTRRSPVAKESGDSLPFGPDRLPGPVASSREAAPSLEPVAQPAVRTASPAVAPTRPAGLASPATHPPARRENRPTEAQQRGSVVGDDDVEVRPMLAADSSQRPDEVLTPTSSDRFLDTRLELLRREASVLLDRARLEHNEAVEQAIRQTLASIQLAQDRHLLAGLQRHEAPRKPQPPRGPVLALAETRGRGDIPVQDEQERDTTPTTGVHRDSTETGVPDPAAAAAAERSARPLTARPIGGPLVFEVRDNQRLSQALSQFLETQGWRLEWESQSDFVVKRGYTVRGPALKDVLLEALGEYRLSAVLYSGNLVVAVSGGDR